MSDGPGEPRRDRFGRYLVVPPSGGKAVPHTRVTSIAEVLDDRYNIERWQQRMVAIGLGVRADLHALAVSTPPSDRSSLNKLCEKAIEAAGGGSRANTGTALHQFTERIDRGEDLEVPEPWSTDVAAYNTALLANKIETIPEYVERIAILEGLSEPVAGTMDRIVRHDGNLYVADLKTGSDLKFSWRAIAIQLALYSRADSLYDPETETHEAVPAVSTEKGIVFHLPAGQGICTPYWIDLEAGWEAAQQALWTRGWRKRDDLAEPLAA